MADTLENFIFRSIERLLAERYTERHALCTSYDPDKHLAKVALMPEGQETGWIPIEQSLAGDGWGLFYGLTPGDGKSTGTQVIVRPQSGDPESFKIVKCVHSDKDKPVKVESGEMCLKHEKGAMIFFKKDGSLKIQDGKGASHTYDGQGNITKAAKNDTHNIEGDRSLNIKGILSHIVEKTWKAKARSGMWSWLTAGSAPTGD